MILLVVNGGIGSQLFQYAAAYELSKKNNSKIYLDLSFINSQKSIPSRPDLAPNLYKLDKVMNVSDCKVIKNIWISRLLRIYFRILHLITLGKLNYKRIDIKNPFEFSEFPIAKNYFINGYPNNLSYVEKYMDEFLSKFITIKYNPETSINDLKKIKIGIHVRKEDLANTSVDICDKDYYSRSIKEIYKMKNLTSKEVEFLIFCQEKEWPKKNINLEGAKVKYFIGNHNDAVEDFKEMYNCDHLIMPNSGFSWWAAQKIMNTKSKALIMCPDLWWDKIDINQINIYPNNWKIMKTGVNARAYKPS